MHGAPPTDQPSDCTHDNKLSLDRSIGDLFRIYGEDYIKSYSPNLQQIKFIRAVRICKTPFLGGKMLVCKSCGTVRYIYHSCGHSQCPLCQSIKRAKWQDELSHKLLKVPYIHTVFTIPHELNYFGKKHPSILYNLVIRSSWQSIKRLTKQPENVGGLPGMVSVLHTFGSDMKYHIHVHSLITFGGLNQGKWMWPKRKKQIASYRSMCRAFREVFLKNLDRVIKKHQLDCPADWDNIRELIGTKRWNVRSTYPSIKTQIIEEYLARYINRVAISPSRLQFIAEQQKVKIIYNDYKNQIEGQVAPKAFKYLKPLIAIHQIVRHVLPPYFQKSRYYGLHASSTFKKITDQIPSYLKRNNQSIRTLFQILKGLLKINPYECETCHSSDYEMTELKPDKEWGGEFILYQSKRAPPMNVKATRLEFMDFTSGQTILPLFD